MPRLESRASLRNNTEETKREWFKGLSTDSARRRPESNIDALSTGDRCDIGFDLEVFLIYAKNRYPLQKYPRRCTETILKLLTCFQYSTRYDRVTEAAKRHYVQEMDIANLIRKQRFLTNAVWGLTSPFQRRVCRHQTKLAIQDKDEI